MFFNLEKFQVGWHVWACHIVFTCFKLQILIFYNIFANRPSFGLRNLQFHVSNKNGKLCISVQTATYEIMNVLYDDSTFTILFHKGTLNSATLFW